MTIPSAAEDMDFCHTCDTETRWNGERCTGCHREWGYENPPIVELLPCGCCECCGCNCQGGAS